MARGRGQSGPYQGGQQRSRRTVFPDVPGRLIEQGMVGEKKLGALVAGLRHHRRAGLKGHQNLGYRRGWVPHLKPHSVLGQGPGKGVSRVQASQDILYGNSHST